MRFRRLIVLMPTLLLALPLLSACSTPTDPAYEQRLDQIRARATFHGDNG